MQERHSRRAAAGRVYRLRQQGASAPRFDGMATLRTQLLLVSLCFAAAYPSGGSEFGLAFLAANKAKPGVVELPSGLQYKVLVSGEGKDHPTKDSPCACMVQALSRWCHSLPPGPPGADSHRTWLRTSTQDEPGRSGPFGRLPVRHRGPAESRRCHVAATNA